MVCLHFISLYRPNLQYGFGGKGPNVVAGSQNCYSEKGCDTVNHITSKIQNVKFLECPELGFTEAIDISLLSMDIYIFPPKILVFPAVFAYIHTENYV